MSSNATSTIPAIGRLFLYKCRAYSEMLSSLLLLQLFAVLLSVTIMNSTTTSGFRDGFRVMTEGYSADIVIAFTMMWGLFSALNVTTKAYREDDFLFVTNRFTSHMSTILFLSAISAAGGVTAAFSTFLVRVLTYYLNGPALMVGTNIKIDAAPFLMGMGAAASYVLLFTAAGYLAGIIVQWHRLLKLILPVVVISAFAVEGTNIGIMLHEFYYQASSFPLFAGKIVGTLLLVFGAALLLANRLEVKQ